MKEIRVLVADDRALIRGGIRALLEKPSELQIVAEACDGPEALRLIRQHQPERGFDRKRDVHVERLRGDCPRAEGMP